jgi:hypothetical protein
LGIGFSLFIPAATSDKMQSLKFVVGLLTGGALYTVVNYAPVHPFVHRTLYHDPGVLSPPVVWLHYNARNGKREYSPFCVGCGSLHAPWAEFGPDGRPAPLPELKDALSARDCARLLNGVVWQRSKRFTRKHDMKAASSAFYNEDPEHWAELDAQLRSQGFNDAQLAAARVRNVSE